MSVASSRANALPARVSNQLKNPMASLSPMAAELLHGGEHTPDHVAVETARGQKARLPGALIRVGRRRVELAMPDVARAIELGRPKVCNDIVHDPRVQPLGLQLLANAHRAELRCAPVHDRVGDP